MFFFCRLDSSNLFYGWFDPYGMHLGVGSDGTARTKPDKAFYNRALAMQQQGQLPDGCTGEAFSSQAHAFINHINPNLATNFNDGHP